jgi:uncharacterized protein involved in exopolysaccharide biosynthesis
MNFNEFENLMSSNGFHTLAEIARKLQTTPQAVSNWKARNQIPYHIVSKLNSLVDSSTKESFVSSSERNVLAEETINLSKIFLILAEQLKIIILLPIIFMFLTFTYVQFIQTPMFKSTSIILLPSAQTSNLGGLAGLATQFGVNISSGEGSQTDLSSPMLIPELLRSRTFAETLLDKTFYIEKFNKKLSLLSILNEGEEVSEQEKRSFITTILPDINDMIQFSSSGTFSYVSIIATEPQFAKEFADVVIEKLGILNSYFKSRSLNEKTNFIDGRINLVDKELKNSEKKYKLFLEQNRQVISPALQLEEERLLRDVDIQKAIYLTLKQQFELAQIEKIERSSIIKILDRPQYPLYPYNIKLRISVLMSGIIGVALAVLFGLFRAYPNSADINDRKVFRRIKNFIKKKSKDFFYDSRIWGILTSMLILTLPVYLTHESKTPIFFGMYSKKLMLIIILYLLALIFSLVMFLRLRVNNK